MKGPLLTHSIPGQLRLLSHRDTAAAGRPGTLVGLAVPFDVELLVEGWWFEDSYREVFRRGAFAKTITDRTAKLPLLAHHDARENPLGAAGEGSLVEEEDGLHAMFELSDTQAGREAATLARDGAISGLSIGFEPVKSTTYTGDDAGEEGTIPLVERNEVKLWEVSLVNFPAYDVARVSDVRSTRPRGMTLSEALTLQLR
jgi:uncharacterized protein